MMYKVYTDKQEVFECKIKLEGASTKNAIARIVLEGQDSCLLYRGDVSPTGVCTIPIKKLKGLMESGDTGTMRLEIISEDVYFQPWQDNFEVATSKSVKVEVVSQAPRSNKRPIAMVTEVSKSGRREEKSPIDALSEMLAGGGLTRKKFIQSEKRILPIIKRFSESIGYDGSFRKIVTEVLRKLPKN